MPPGAFPISHCFSFPPPGSSSSSWVRLASQHFYPRGRPVRPLSRNLPPFCFVSSAWRAFFVLHEDFSPPQRLLLESTMTGEQSISQSAASPQQSLAWGPCKHLRRQKSTFLDSAPGFPVRAHRLRKLLARLLERTYGTVNRTVYAPQATGSMGRRPGPFQRGPAQALYLGFPRELGAHPTWAEAWPLGLLTPRAAEGLLGVLRL